MWGIEPKSNIMQESFDQSTVSALSDGLFLLNCGFNRLGFSKYGLSEMDIEGARELFFVLRSP
jgi:hypothetical protein